MNDHTENEILYAEHYLAWLRAGKPEGKEPWRNWEWKWPMSEQKWERIKSIPTWVFGIKYRYNPRPKTIRIGDIDVPAPMDVRPKMGGNYWLADAAGGDLAVEDKWDGGCLDERCFNRRLIHATEENAIAHARALILVSGGTLESGK